MAATATESNRAGQQDQKERRIDVLARHRPIPAGHRNDMRSVYWVDCEPLGAPTAMAMTPRLEVLSKSRHLQGYTFNHDRDFIVDKESFYKEIRPAGDVPAASPRVEQLSAHKTLRSEYEYDRMLPTEVGKPAEASPRVTTMSGLRNGMEWRQSSYLDRYFYDYLPQPVSAAAQKGTSTPRVEALAEHKSVHPSFLPERPVRSQVGPQAMKVVASLRVSQLARPRSRQMTREDTWDPYAVPRSARNAQITPRVEELATPMPRKQKTKKAV